MKKIAIFTSTRADYGLLKPLIKRLAQDSFFKPQLFVTGTHFDKKFGHTVDEIKKDFSKYIFYKVPQNMKESPKYKNLNIMADSVSKYSKALQKSLPDVAIILGDRYETLCFALVCHSLRVPIAHIHGGELTYGALDEQYRHCITKLSTLHFTACETYRKRVIQLGEDPKRVFNVGALGIENALHHPLLTKKELEKSLKVKLPEEFYVLTFHPETHSKDYGLGLLKAFLKNLKNYVKSKNTFVIITGVNSDPGGKDIREVLKSFCKTMGLQKTLFVESLGVSRYLSAVKFATAVLGNSSSGILEVHSLKTPCVNIGLRQEGREREKSVIDLVTKQECTNFDLTSLRLRKKRLSKPTSSLFGNGNVSWLIVNKLKKNFELQSKSFFDI